MMFTESHPKKVLRERIVDGIKRSMDTLIAVNSSLFQFFALICRIIKDIYSVIRYISIMDLFVRACGNLFRSMLLRSPVKVESYTG